MANPIPVVFARPSEQCGEEAIVQVVVSYTVKAGIRIETRALQQCGCAQLPTSGVVNTEAC